jgi:flagellin
MRIRQNLSSSMAWRALSTQSSQMETSIARLSSGSRINEAGDDVAGLSISERMRSQFQSLNQASKNAMDGLSLVNTAEATLEEVLSLLQRGRELSVQAANQIYQTDQKTSIQTEAENILAEIDRIADTAEFNKIKLFTSGSGAGASTKVVNGLRTGWLEQAEDVIRTYYGLEGNHEGLNIVLTRGTGQTPWISGSVEAGGQGKLTNITMTLDLDVLNAAPDADRIVARALTQAVLARNSNYVSLSRWFISGASDLVAGGDEMLAEALKTYSSASIIGALSSPWADDLLHQAAAYVATKYLQVYTSAYGFTMVDPMAWLKTAGDLDAAMLSTIFMDEASFKVDFAINGQAFLDSLILSGQLNDPDVGGLQPGNSKDVIPDGGGYSVNPTKSFTIRWQGISEEELSMRLHIGPGANDSVQFALPQIGRVALDLLGVNLVTKADEAIGQFSKAIQKVSTARTQLGSTANALEHTIRANQEAELSLRASYSRIRDADYAKELLTLTKQQILVQSSSQVLAKANRLRENTAWLLSSLRGGGGMMTAPA